MDVLVLGPQSTAVDAAAQQLTAAGHGVHRCVTPQSALDSPAGCVGAIDHSACPLAGPVDVALMVGEGATSEGIAPLGLGCAARDHLPLATLLEGETEVAACEGALDTRDTEWTDRLRALLGRDDVTCRTTRHLSGLHLAIDANIPPDDAAAAAKLATRAYDAVRNDLPRGFTSVDVSVTGFDL